MKIRVIAKFSKPGNAENFIYGAHATTGKMLRIFMGDDQLFWVVTMADGERLLRGGLEEWPG